MICLLMHLQLEGTLDQLFWCPLPSFAGNVSCNVQTWCLSLYEVLSPSQIVSPPVRDSFEKWQQGTIDPCMFQCYFKNKNTFIKIANRNCWRVKLMIGWHHRLNGHEFEQTLKVGDGQGSLVCCSPWGRKESDMTERLNWWLKFLSSIDLQEPEN